MKKLVVIALLHFSILTYAQFYTPNQLILPTNDPSTGFIGIGTGSPNRHLTITNTGVSTYLNVKANSGASEVLFGIDAFSGIVSTMTNHDLSLRAGGNQTFMTLKANGRVGIGTSSPDYSLQIHSSDNPTIAIGKINYNTSGKSSLLFNAGNGSSSNVFWINYNKTASTDRLAFVDGGAIERMSISNGGHVRLNGTSGGTVLSIIENPNSGVGAHFVSEGANNIKFQLKRTTDGVVNTELRTVGNSFMNANSGNVGIGTTNPDAKLAVKGTIHAEEVKVDLQIPGPDYVFEPTYQLPSLTEIENYIKTNKHLPEVPSAKEMETNGINLSEMNMLLLKKVEELTLHLIEMQKENSNVQKRLTEQQKEIEILKLKQK
jgi:hypothetical protein